MAVPVDRRQLRSRPAHLRPRAAAQILSRANGYADFRVVSAVAELTPDRDGFYITFTIEEGERYTFGNDRRRHRRSATSTPSSCCRGSRPQGGRLVRRRQGRATRSTALTDAVGNRGYAFVDVRPRITRDREARTVDLTFEIQEGPRVYVERIDIVGNVRTLDKVIRREFRLAEGDAFNTAKLRRSRQRIRNLGFFEKVEVTNVPGEAPDRTVVNVEVAGAVDRRDCRSASASRPRTARSATSRMRERNLLGRGQDLRSASLISQRRAARSI